MKAKCPEVSFLKESFAKGDEDKRLARIEEFISEQRPVVVSLTNKPYGGEGWHIMAVVNATAAGLTLLDYIDKAGNEIIKTVSKADFVKYHNQYPGGDDIAYLEL